MPFWRTETLQERLRSESLINPFDKSRIKHCAYELAMGPEAFITSTLDKTKTKLEKGESIVIPPGQFAMLLTEEEVKVPLSAIAFISIRFGFKRQGLINVSGFHVDPGFGGRLKFSVYNAGSKDITISRGDQLFMIWYADLDEETEDEYRASTTTQNEITSDDQNMMHGDVASPAELKKQITQLEYWGVHRKWLLVTIAGTLIGILIRLLFMSAFATPTPSDMDRLKKELRNELRQEIKTEIDNHKQTDHKPNNPNAQNPKP